MGKNSSNKATNRSSCCRILPGWPPMSWCAIRIVRYSGYGRFVEGIAFTALRDNVRIVNYPKKHYDNGAAKSRYTRDRYKRTVRMFKNARNRLESDNLIGKNLAPSYFIECLLYNAPDRAFQPRFQDTYCSIVNWINSATLDGLVCQNEQHHLFGNHAQQWSTSDARTLCQGLISLWNNWE